MLSVLCCLFVLLSVSFWKVFVLALHLRGAWIVQHCLCPQNLQFFNVEEMNAGTTSACDA